MENVQRNFSRLSATLWLATVALLPLAAAARADEPPLPADIGVFGRYTRFDKDVQFDNKLGVGGRVMAFFLPRWGVEVDASFTPTHGTAAAPDVNVFTTHGRVLYGLPIAERSQLLLGLGYAHNDYMRDVPHWGDSGPGALVGLRLGLNDRWTARFDATYDYMFGSADLWDLGHLGLQAGLGWSPLYRHPTRPARTGRSAETDSDRDGVPDSRDACPGSPYGAIVDATGCPPVQDSDGDGVNDALDRCPNTPRGERVDASGCSLPRDSDGDGVMDDRDRCPGTSYGTKVDVNGCPDLFKGGQSLVLDGVNFETARSVLTPDSRDILDRVAATLVANPDVRIEVSGHTDSRGSRDMNRGLSLARAQAVLDYLAMQGVARDRMVAAGYGPDQPVDSNDTAEGRARNRRVELRKLN